MAEKLSVLIPTFNEATNLPDCISSVKDMADEIFVVDSFSRDETVQLAEAAGARGLQHEYVNSAAKKNWAIPQCKHDWVFIIDADERMTPELKKEVLGMLAVPKGPELDGYFVVRRNFFLGGEIKHGGWETNDVQRLFRKDQGRYAEREVHADVLLVGNGQRGELFVVILHLKGSAVRDQRAVGQTDTQGRTDLGTFNSKAVVVLAVDVAGQH